MRTLAGVAVLAAALLLPGTSAGAPPQVRVEVSSGQLGTVAFAGGALTLRLTNDGPGPVTLGQRFPAAPAVEYLRGGVPFRAAGTFSAEGPTVLAPGATVEWKSSFSPGIVAGAPIAAGTPEVVQVRVAVLVGGIPVLSPLVQTKLGIAALDRRFAIDLPLATGPVAGVPRQLSASLAARAGAELRAIAAGKGEPPRLPALAALVASLGATSEAEAIVAAARAPGFEAARPALLRALGQLGGAPANAVVLETLRGTKRFDGKEVSSYQAAVEAAARLKLAEATAPIAANLPLLPPHGSALPASLDALVRLGGPAVVPAISDALSRALAPPAVGSRRESDARRAAAGDAAFALCRLGARAALEAAVASPELSAAAPWDAEVQRALALAGKGPACDAVKHRPLP